MLFMDSKKTAVKRAGMVYHVQHKVTGIVTHRFNSHCSQEYFSFGPMSILNFGWHSKSKKIFAGDVRKHM